MTQGCDVNGSVFNSVLSDNVVVEEGADVQYSVLMPGGTVRRGAVVKYAILGEKVQIWADAKVGGNLIVDKGFVVATLPATGG